MAFNTPGSAANLTGQVVFQRLGVQVEPVFINNAIALEKMRSGEVSAVVHVVGKPNDLFARFKPEPGFHFIPVEYGPQFEDYYVPASSCSWGLSQSHPDWRDRFHHCCAGCIGCVQLAENQRPLPSCVPLRWAYFSKFNQLQQPPFQPKWQRSTWPARFRDGRATA